MKKGDAAKSVRHGICGATPWGTTRGETDETGPLFLLNVAPLLPQARIMGMDSRARPTAVPSCRSTVDFRPE